MLSSSRSSVQAMLYLIPTGLSHSTFALLGSDLRLSIYVALEFPPEQASGIPFCDHDLFFIMKWIQRSSQCLLRTNGI